jgi:hypothetical protein
MPTAKSAPLSAERLALAEAQARLAAAEREFAEMTSAARAGHEARSAAALAAEDEAKAALRAAEGPGGPAGALARALGQGDTVPLATARAALEAATAECRAIAADRELLQQAVADRREHVDGLRVKVEVVLGAVLGAAPEIKAMLAEYRETYARHETIRAALMSLGVGGALPNQWDSLHRSNEVIDWLIVEKWKRAAAALRADAAAPLPDGLPPAPIAEAA